MARHTVRVDAPRSTRQQMLESALWHLRRGGLAAFSVDEVVRHAGAPRGSVYHHFPEGRSQLIAEAMAAAAGQLVSLIQATTADVDSPVAAVAMIADAFRSAMLEADFEAGCPLATVALEAGPEDVELRATIGHAFGAWQAAVTDVLLRGGLAMDTAMQHAAASIAAVEGGLVLARSLRDVAAFDGAVQTHLSSLRAVLTEV